MIALFAYDFPHRKTHDFIIELFLRHGRNFCVLAAPAKTLAVDRVSYFSNGLRNATAIAAQNLCESLDVPFYCVEHDKHEEILKIKRLHGLSIGIIAGARIIPEKVIDIFTEGIINFHPGKIPETSGLDAFFYTIKNNSPAGITTHFIDARVDAGRLISFDELQINPSDEPATVHHNNYQLQITCLRKTLGQLASTDITTTPLQRPKKNIPMTPSEKVEILQKFPAWRADRYLRQQEFALFEACRTGEIIQVESILGRHPHFLESKSIQGWTPLIVAAFNNSKNIVELLLKKGANPNACGLKGTTVLMYAKTPLINQTEIDTSIIEMLFAHGADFSRKDMFGKTIFDYINETGNQGLIDKFKIYYKD